MSGDAEHVGGARVCEFFNRTCLDATGGADETVDNSTCFGREICTGSGTHACFTAWHHVQTATSDHPTGWAVQLMGCFLYSDECSSPNNKCQHSIAVEYVDTGHRPGSVAHPSEAGLSVVPEHNETLFCCCTGDMCNSEFGWTHVIENSTDNLTGSAKYASTSDHQYLALALAVVIVTLLSTVAFVCLRRQQKSPDAACSNLTLLTSRFWQCLTSRRQMSVPAQEAQLYDCYPSHTSPGKAEQRNRLLTLGQVSGVRWSALRGGSSMQPILGHVGMQDSQMPTVSDCRRTSGMLDSSSCNNMTEDDIELLEIRGRGRFGAVWHARQVSSHQSVAVKVFALQDKSSWVAEQSIYRLPLMSHDNILGFIGLTSRGIGLEQEFWLISAYHPLGSLNEFLHSNCLTWRQMCSLALAMISGLAHLHEEIHQPVALGAHVNSTSSPSSNDGGGSGAVTSNVKPSVAHRDFKSKNVLVTNHGWGACIADFGLALVFQPGAGCGDTHGQVGTRRYMAPEVLEGAISFSRDSFLRIDMYACALVLWELVSRVSSDHCPPPPPYMLPFDDYLSNSSLEDMHRIVVVQRARPAMPPHWLDRHRLMSEFVATVTECWDADAEARLTASNVKERIKTLIQIDGE